MKLFNLAFVGLFGISLAAGCGGTSTEDICDRVCECKQCTDESRAQCISSGQQFENQAVAAGCQDQLDEYLSCFDEKLVCANGDAEIIGCGAAVDALNSCIKPGTPDGSGGGV